MGSTCRSSINARVCGSIGSTDGTACGTCGSDSAKRYPSPANATFPYSEILHCSAPAVLARWLEHAKLPILRRQRTLALVADERLFPVPPRGIPKADYAFYRSPLLEAGDLDRLYSELVLLPI